MKLLDRLVLAGAIALAGVGAALAAFGGDVLYSGRALGVSLLLTALTAILEVVF